MSLSAEFWAHLLGCLHLDTEGAGKSAKPQIQLYYFMILLDPELLSPKP